MVTQTRLCQVCGEAIPSERARRTVAKTCSAFCSRLNTLSARARAVKAHRERQRAADKAHRERQRAADKAAEGGSNA